jgi:hypothetical protein
VCDNLLAHKIPINQKLDELEILHGEAARLVMPFAGRC